MENGDCLMGRFSNLKCLYDKWIAEINADSYMSQLTIEYKKWLTLLQNSYPYLLEDKYSNPTYIYVPQNWKTAKNKIMIVGKEGYGEWGYGKKYGWVEKSNAWNPDDFADIQLYNRDLLFSQTVYYHNDYMDEKYTDFNTWFTNLYKQRDPFHYAFWKRFLRIYQLSPQNTSITWTNSDKIFALKNSKNGSALSVRDRKNLHSLNYSILAEEIKITQPTVVVFFGVYWNIINIDLNNIYKLTCNKEQSAKWKAEKICVAEDEKRIYVFSQHPAFKTKLYEDKVIDIIKDYVKK